MPGCKVTILSVRPLLACHEVDDFSHLEEELCCIWKKCFLVKHTTALGSWALI